MSSSAFPRLPLLRLEAQRLWRLRAVRWLCLLAPLLLVLVFVPAFDDAATLAEERTRFAAAERARWLEQGAKDPHSAAHFGVWAVKPASPLAVLTPGVEPFVGLAVWLEAHKRNEMIFRPGQDGDPVALAAASVAQALELLGPLFALLLGFAAFARDRQNGSLRLALGNGAAPGRMLLGRFALMALVLLACLVLPASLLGLWCLLRLPDAGWEAGGRLLAWSTVHLLYLLGFMLAALAVSLRAGSTRAALVMLLGGWVLLCVLLPRAAGNLAQALAPTPSYQQVRQHAENEAPAYEDAERWEARKRDLLAKAGGRPIDLRAAQLDQSERDSHAVFDRLLGHFYDAVERQDRSYGWLAALSPTVALQTTATALAGTDFHQHRHFIDAAEHYRRDMVNRMNGALVAHAGHEQPIATDRDFWASMPEFRYRPPPLAQAAGQAAAPLALLLLWCALAALAAWRALRGVRP